MNVTGLSGNTEYQLAPDHVLRAANADEKAEIQKHLKSMAGGSALWDQPNGPGYFIITTPANPADITINQLELVFALTKSEIEIGFKKEQPAIISYKSANHFFQVLDSLRNNKTELVAATPAVAEETSSLLNQLGQASNPAFNVAFHAYRLNDIKGLPHASDLRFLAYFAVLESILTHAPKKTDPYDSITRQVKKKLALLNTRWPEKLNYATFDNKSHDKVWGAMYSYRSVIAHGDPPSFTKDLKCLKNHGQALGLLKETTKKVIRQGMIEPELIRDLRDC